MSITTKHGFKHRGGHFISKKIDPPDPTKPKRLWPHQRRFLKELRDALHWFIIGPPAAGKTLTIMALLYCKLSAQPKLRSIVAVPQTIIGEGFSDCSFYIGNRPVVFDPTYTLLKPGEDSNREQFKRYLLRKPGTNLDDRALICTHQTLVQAYQEFPELFTDVVVVVDEAHHSKAEETKEGDMLANQLGATVIDLVDRGQQVGLATATASRADGCGLMGPHQDKFKTEECPFDQYLKVCRWFRQFAFMFVLYSQLLGEAVNDLLGDKRKRPPRTIIHIPNAHSRDSGGKEPDLRQVYRGLAGCSRPRIKNPNGVGDGITLVKRGRRWLRVVDLVNEDNRQLKKDAIVAAHNAPDDSNIDCIIALNMFKEGANWRWAQKSIIVGHRGSFTELIQMVGRALRDAPDKHHVDIHYCLPKRQYDPDDSTQGVLNNYLKAVLFGLLLEDVFQPVEIRAKNKTTGKCQTVKTDLLLEAVGYNMDEKLRAEEAVIERLLEYDQIDLTQTVAVVGEVLQECGIEHPNIALRDVARQLALRNQRRNQQVTKQSNQDLVDIGGIEVALVSAQYHPLQYLQYYCKGIGIQTLLGLRTALQEYRERSWWEKYQLVLAYIDETKKFPISTTVYKGKKTGCVD